MLAVKWGRRTARWHVVHIPVTKMYSYIPLKFCRLEADLRLWLGGLCVCVCWGGGEGGPNEFQF